MSTAVFLTEGLDISTKNLLGQAIAITPKLRMFSNNVNPAASDTLGTYTANGLAGGADVAITPANWVGSSAGGVATYTYPNITFTFAAYAGGTTIYGGVYFDNTSGKALFAFTLDTPYAVPAAGGTLTVAMTFSDHKC